MNTLARSGRYLELTVGSLFCLIYLLSAPTWVWYVIRILAILNSFTQNMMLLLTPCGQVNFLFFWWFIIFFFFFFFFFFRSLNNWIQRCLAGITGTTTPEVVKYSLQANGQLVEQNKASVLSVVRFLVHNKLSNTVWAIPAFTSSFYVVREIPSFFFN